MKTSRKPVAVIVPCANPAVEPEIHALLPATYFPYVARLPFYADRNLKQRLAQYVLDLPNSIATIKDLKPTGALVACTGSSYPLGVAGDAAWTKAATDQLAAPVVSAAGAVGAVLAKLEVTKLTLISPYPAWLTAEVIQYWTNAGYEITEVIELDKSGKIYDLTAADIKSAISTALANITSGNKHALLLAGTGVPSLEPIDEIVGSTEIPIVTSQLAGVWQLLQEIGAASEVQLSASAALRRLDLHLTKGV